MHPPSVVAFEARHAAGVAAVCEALGWPSYADPAVAATGCAAAGVTTMVAVADDDVVVGFAQVLGDGVVQGYLAQLGVLPAYRHHGMATRLVKAAFAASGVKRLDLLTDDAAGFYERFPHRSMPGLRIYPIALRGD